jgi:ATP-binding protein involved in chromosome partitioning
MSNTTSKKKSVSSGDMGDPANNNSRPPSDPQDEKINKSLAGIRNILMVMSGKGGVGKSSISAGLSVSLTDRGFKVGLLDLDIHGPSLAGIMGVKGLLDITADQKVLPKEINANLKVISIQSLMQDVDQAVIWRGPAKTGVIRQFLGDVQWGELDYLIIDAPPGTGDEPLSVAQIIPQAKAVIVTTPQDVALADVRKSISFCRTVNLKILGLIENMGPFACPCCGKTISLFKDNGGEATARQMNVPFLGTLPFDAEVVKVSDQGEPLKLKEKDSSFYSALGAIVDNLRDRVKSA